MDDKRLGAAPSLNEFEVLEGGKWRAPPVGHAFSRLVLNFNADSDDAAAAAASGSLNLAGDSGVDSNSEESEKGKKVKWPYLSDEEIFASFSTKRKYEREWRHKKKKKGGKKHTKKTDTAKDGDRCLDDVQSSMRLVEKTLSSSECSNCGHSHQG